MIRFFYGFNEQRFKGKVITCPVDRRKEINLVTDEVPYLKYLQNGFDLYSDPQVISHH
jgi:hypothetical protein